uniref:Uncharacterized protein n=1 Tax=Solanum tuberosum TaxID=4113 RepID=M1AA43_SOLTU
MSTFFYNIFLEEEEEEAAWPKIELENPWQIKIKITSYEVEAGVLLIPYIKMFGPGQIFGERVQGVCSSVGCNRE